MARNRIRRNVANNPVAPDQPPVPEAPPTQAQARAQRALRRQEERSARERITGPAAPAPAPPAPQAGISPRMMAFHLATLAAIWFYHEQVLDWALHGPSDPRLRSRAVPLAHEVPDCGPRSCTESFVADGTHADAVSALVDTTLHHFVSANAAHLGPDPSVQMSYEAPRTMHGAIGSARPGSGKIRLSIENVVRQARFVSSGNADAALMQSVYHECTHALGSAAFGRSARRLGAKVVQADPYLRRSDHAQRNDVVLEALTAALEHVPGISGRSYSREWTGLMVDRRQRPVSWRQFGVHLVDQLGEATIKKAVFSNDAVAVRALEGYIDALIRTQPRKVLVLPVV